MLDNHLSRSRANRRLVPHISVWGSSFVGCHPRPTSARPPARPSLPPSLAPSRRSTHSLTHSLTHPLTHSLTHSLPSTHSSHSLTQFTHSLTHSLSSLARSLTHSLASLHSLTHCTQLNSTHSTSLNPLTHSHSLTRSLTHSLTLTQGQWQRAVAAEPPEALCSARVVASTQSLQKGLRRALSPLGPHLSLQWQAQYPEPPEWGCGARCRRWAPPLSLQWQAQYPEPPESLQWQA